MRSAPPVTVAILAFPETTASVVYGLYDLFASTGREWGFVVDGQPGPELMRPVVTAVRAEAFEAANGVIIVPQTTLDAAPADIVCVPELAVPPTAPIGGRFAREIEWLQERYAAGATLASACSGAVLLAEAGLLDGQDATTHWAYCDVLRAAYPKVRVHPERALVLSGDEQRLVMAGGGTSWHDVALYLIARFAGIDAAMQVARINLIDWHEVGQQPFARLARTRQVGDAVIARCQGWIADHYREPSPVTAMIRMSGIAERSLKRRFRAATGLSPLEYVHMLRLEAAKELLESGDQPAEAVAFEVGYEDAAFFRRLFRRHVRLTPSQYRKRFGSLRRALAGA
ncbi:MAG TPA: helix-turn-helix domain-containing protein [Gemmatimonadales bacterium]|nr:helix-turn-helix domain-containing protein [Gemmatimonadales bacterium]